MSKVHGFVISIFDICKFKEVAIKRSDFSILCLQGFCIAFNVASVSAIVPAIASDFGISDFVAGRINWAYMLPYGIMALLYGP
ncbi:MAG: hypothetical protein PHS61_05615, partial [Candidatus Omnitrophica bacterium]|nr:hypothetical protein [Candidatus Omnitrophota bacterium]